MPIDIVDLLLLLLFLLGYTIYSDNKQKNLFVALK